MADLFEEETFTPEEIEAVDWKDSTLSDKGTEEVVGQLEDEIEFGDRPIQTALESLADTWSFGITDQAISALGPESKRIKRKKRKT